MKKKLIGVCLALCLAIVFFGTLISDYGVINVLVATAVAVVFTGLVILCVNLLVSEE